MYINLLVGSTDGFALIEIKAGLECQDQTFFQANALTSTFDPYIAIYYRRGEALKLSKIQTGPELAIFILQQKNNYTKSCQQLHDLCNYLKTEF